MYKLFYSLLLLALWESLINAFPSHDYCNPEVTKEKYIKKIWHESDDLANIGKLLSETDRKVHHKLHALKEKVDFVVAFAENHEFDISECLDFEYINSYPKHVEESLTKFGHMIKENSSELFDYVIESIGLIVDCGNSNDQCDEIETCCKEVVEYFDEDFIEDGVGVIEEFSKEFLYYALETIDNEINSIQQETNLCYLEHQQTTEKPVETTEPVEITEPVEENTTDDEDTNEPEGETTTEEVQE